MFVWPPIVYGVSRPSYAFLPSFARFCNPSSVVLRCVGSGFPSLAAQNGIAGQFTYPASRIGSIETYNDGVEGPSRAVPSA
jgi:hypothetical protein